MRGLFRWHAFERVGVVLSLLSGPVSGQGPLAAVVVEAEVDEAAEVDGGNAGGEAVLVAFDASVADAPVAFGDEPGDGSFDHGPVLAVVADEVTVSPGPAGGDEFGVVGVDTQGAPIDGCGASRL